jgi:EAL domain-containing protein (putative c-di-GMP-specific phosphodiesterase class I)
MGLSDTGLVAGVEALSRWYDPEQGLISPADFIPQLEESALMVEVGSWVLRATCNPRRGFSISGWLVTRRQACSIAAIL